MERGKDGTKQEYDFDGTIRRDPVDRPLRVAAMTGQNHVGYPYSPVVENLKKLNPDLLYFSGDQIYESNGGYGIIRRPADRSILNYLGKCTCLAGLSGISCAIGRRSAPLTIMRCTRETFGVKGGSQGPTSKKTATREALSSR